MRLLPLLLKRSKQRVHHVHLQVLRNEHVLSLQEGIHNAGNAYGVLRRLQRLLGVTTIIRVHGEIHVRNLEFVGHVPVAGLLNRNAVNPGGHLLHGTIDVEGRLVHLVNDGMQCFRRL